MLTQPDRFDVALLHLDRPVFYQVLFFFYNAIMKQKYKIQTKSKDQNLPPFSITNI